MGMVDMWLGMMSTNIFSVGVDIVLIVVLLGMWALWWKQGQRTQRIETGLLEAAAQLQEATALLDDALNQISLLQRQQEKINKVTEVGVTPPMPVSMHADDLDDDIEPQFSSRARELLKAKQADLEMKPVQVAPRSNRVEQAAQQSKQGVMDVAKILRMQREGASLDSIADTLNMPLAQVKLMLMLQKGV
ncbi:MAG: hypothetical protein Q9M15_00660 [Mariprofundaceae bacterium]|nr:hypothetical protein [Mariprofundaceae bacterium]